jgi:hypothetical protein
MTLRDDVSYGGWPCVPASREDDVDTMRRCGHVALPAHVVLEEGAERVLVGDVEHAERGDRHVDVDRLDVAAERALGLAARDHLAEQVDDRPVERGQRRKALHVAAARLVLGHHQPHEVLVGDVIVVGEVDDAAHRLHRGQVVELEAALGVADLRVDGSRTARYSNSLLSK